MYPAGGLMMARAIQDERLRNAERRNRRAATAAPKDGDRARPDPWTAILRLPRFGTSNAKG